jgi:prepilin-type N-terminal cleavage/methylation domain-containing protein
MKFKQNKKLGFSLIELSVSILIIGLLIIGVQRAGQIVSEGKLIAARSLSRASFANLNSDKLALWYDATAIGSFGNVELEDGADVDTWFDVNPSPDSNNIDVDDTGTKPVYIADATNGLPAVRFTSNSELSRLNVSAGDLTEDGEQITIFLVQNYFSPNHFSSSFVWNVDGVGEPRISSHALWIDGFIYFNFGTCCGGGTAIQASSAQPFSDRTNILSYRRSSNDPGNDSGNDSGIIRINGITAVSSDTLTADIDISLTANLTRNFIVGNLFNGDINELIIFKTALKDSQIQSVERYLSKKWNSDLEN